EILLNFAHFQEQLADSDITLHKLEKLAGLVKSSEKVKNSNAVDRARNKEKPASQEKPEIEHKVCHHKLEGLSKGDICPKCNKGKVYKYEPAVTVRVSGHSPLVSTKHIRERLRCNACGEYFTAPLPQEVIDDGGKDND